MMQEVLVILSIAGAAAYLARLFYKTFFSKNDACSGCVVYKLHQAKMEHDQQKA